MKKSKSVSDMTNFYYPGWCLNMSLQSKQANPSDSDEEDPDAEEEKETSIDMNGFVGSQSGDIPYETMFEYFDFSMNFFMDIDNSAYFENMPDIAWDVTKKSGPMFWVRTEPIPVNLKADIVAKWLWKHRKIDF